MDSIGKSPTSDEHLEKGGQQGPEGLVVPFKALRDDQNVYKIDQTLAKQ